MVDHQRQMRMTLGEIRHDPQQVLGLGAHVEGQVAVGEHRQHVVDSRVDEQVGIGIAVNEMAHTDDRGVRPPIESALCGRRVEEWHPPDHACNAGVGRSELEHQLGVVDVIGGLDENDGDDACSVQFLVDVADIKSPVELGCLGEPRVVNPCRVPNVNVAVDHHLERFGSTVRPGGVRRHECSGTHGGPSGSEHVVDSLDRRVQVVAHRG